MADFSTLPPSRKRPALEGYFPGGLLVACTEPLALFVIDVRNLKLTAKQASKLEQGTRDYVLKQLRSMKIDVDDRAVVDMGPCISGMAIE